MVSLFILRLNNDSQSALVHPILSPFLKEIPAAVNKPQRIVYVSSFQQIAKYKSSFQYSSITTEFASSLPRCLSKLDKKFILVSKCMWYHASDGTLAYFKEDSVVFYAIPCRYPCTAVRMEYSRQVCIIFLTLCHTRFTMTERLVVM